MGHSSTSYFTGIDSITGRLWELLLLSGWVQVEGYRRISEHLVQHFNPPSVKSTANSTWMRHWFGNFKILLNAGE